MQASRKAERGVTNRGRRGFCLLSLYANGERPTITISSEPARSEPPRHFRPGPNHLCVNDQREEGNVSSLSLKTRQKNLARFQKERQRLREGASTSASVCVCVCVRVSLCEGETEKPMELNSRCRVHFGSFLFLSQRGLVP